MGRVTSYSIKLSTADIWFAYLDPAVGHEQGGRRPVVLVSSELLHAIPSALVYVVPCTTRDRRVISHVEVVLREGDLSRATFAMAEQLRAVSVLRLRKRIGAVDDQTLERIRRRVALFMDFDVGATSQ